MNPSSPYPSGPSPPYERVYGVSLMDDLHNYFPGLLYDSSSFSSLQDVLAYVQTQARNRFDLYSRARSQYQYQNQMPYTPASSPAGGAPASPAASAAAAALNQRYYAYLPMTATNASDLGFAYYSYLPRTENDSTLQSPFAMPQVRVTRSAEDEEEAITNTLISRALLQLLALPQGPLTRGNNATGFMNPVIVRPTAEQISQNTIVGNLVSDEPQSCAICQDSLLPDQQARKLRACGHWFHIGCIDPWFQRNVHCPVCRHDVREAVATRQGTIVD